MGKPERYIALIGEPDPPRCIIGVYTGLTVATVAPPPPVETFIIRPRFEIAALDESAACLFSKETGPIFTPKRKKFKPRKR